MKRNRDRRGTIRGVRAGAAGRLAAGLLLALAAAVLPAVSLAQTEIVVWHAYRGEERAAFEKVVAAYNQERGGQGIRVSTLAVPYDAFADKITAAVPRGRGPDVFIYAQDRLGGWVEAGNTIEPIDFFVDDAVRGSYFPTTMQAMTYRGALYGLPLNYKVIAMIYNRKLVQQPPATSAQLIETARRLTDAGAGRFGLAYWYSNFYYHAPVMNAFGGGVFDPNGRPTINSDANVRSVEWVRGLMQQGLLPAEPSTALVTTLFNEGRAAMVFSGPWFLGEVAQGIDVGLAPLPTVAEAGNAPMRPWMTVEGVYIAAPSQKKQQAFDFVRYLTDVPAGATMAVEGRQTPANMRVYDDPRVANDAVLQVFRKQVDVAIPMPNTVEMTMIWTPVTTAMNTVVQGSATPKAALDAAQREVQQSIERLRR